jgi:DNA-binding NtrC family response regulator
MKKKVLIVDDEPGIIEVMQDYIEHSGIGLQVISANSVDEALLLVESEKPNVIISDIAMPVKNGLDFLRELVARQKRIPVIVVSGYGDKEMISKAWKLGAFDFLDKPINSKRLLENLKIAVDAGEEVISANAAAPQSVRIMLDAQVLDKVTKAAAAAKMTVDKWIIELIKKSTP